jgi:hypothetical protein
MPDDSLNLRSMFLRDFHRYSPVIQTLILGETKYEIRKAFESRILYRLRTVSEKKIREEGAWKRVGTSLERVFLVPVCLLAVWGSSIAAI